MDKSKFQRLIQKSREGSLTPEEENLLEQAYGELLAEEIAAVKSHPVQWPDEEKGAMIRRKIYARIGGQPRRPSIYRPLLKVAVSVLLFVFTSITAYHYRFDIFDKINPIQEHHFATTADAIKTLTLKDGTVVWLNKNSSITYPEQFRGNERRVKVQGEVYFQVAPDKEMPFIVHSGPLDVQVLGTSFVVSDQESTHDKRVTVLTGKVSVATPEQQPALLLPDQQIIFNEVTGKSRQHQVKAATAIAFVRDDIDFRDVPLSNILKAMETRFNVQIDFNPETVRGKNFSGKVMRDDQLKDVMDILSGTLNFKYTCKDDTSIIILTSH